MSKIGAKLLTTVCLNICHRIQWVKNSTNGQTTEKEAVHLQLNDDTGNIYHLLVALRLLMTGWMCVLSELDSKICQIFFLKYHLEIERHRATILRFLLLRQTIDNLVKMMCHCVDVEYKIRRAENGKSLWNEQLFKHFLLLFGSWRVFCFLYGQCNENERIRLICYMV